MSRIHWLSSRQLLHSILIASTTPSSSVTASIAGRQSRLVENRVAFVRPRHTLRTTRVEQVNVGVNDGNGLATRMHDAHLPKIYHTMEFSNSPTMRFNVGGFAALVPFHTIAC